MNTVVNSKTVGIKIIMSGDPVALLLLNEIQTHIVTRFKGNNPERLILKNDFSDCILKVAGKKISTRVRQWSHRIVAAAALEEEESFTITFELQDLNFRNQKKNYFEIHWKQAIAHPTIWFTWQSVEFQQFSFNKKLELMATSEEQVLALKEKYGDKFAEKPIRTILSNISLLRESEETIGRAQEEDNFRFSFPSRLLPLIDKIDGVRELHRWYEEECEPPTKDRRRALVLYSETRGLGKSKFAEEICGYDESRWIYVSGISFCKGNFDNEKTSKLLLLDDFIWDPSKEEIMKGLVVSRRVNIRDAYFQHDFKHGLPTILTINRADVWKHLRESRMFNTQCCFVEIKCYIGPPEKKPAWIDNPDIWTAEISSLTQQQQQPPQHPRSVSQSDEYRMMMVVAGEDEHGGRSNDSERFQQFLQAQNHEMRKIYRQITEEYKTAMLEDCKTAMQTEMDKLRKFLEHKMTSPSISTTTNNNTNTNSNSHNHTVIHQNHFYSASNSGDLQYITSPTPVKRGLPPVSSTTAKQDHSILEDHCSIKKKLFREEEKDEYNRFAADITAAAGDELEEEKQEPTNQEVSSKKKSEKAGMLPPLPFLPSSLIKKSVLPEKWEWCPMEKLRRLLCYAEKRKIVEETKLQKMYLCNEMLPPISTQVIESQQNRTKDVQVQFYSLKAYFQSFGNSLSVSTETTKVQYFPSKKMNTTRLGRGYAHTTSFKGGIVQYGALQTFKRLYRAYLCSDDYWDVDLVNSHPSILLWQLQSRNQHVPVILSEYVDTRETVLEEIQVIFGTDRDCAKELMLRYMYGGNYNSWMAEYSIEEPKTSREQLALFRKLGSFAAELKQAGSVLGEKYFPHIKKIWDSSQSELKKESSLLSLILQEQEKTVLLFADAFFTEENRSLDVLIHDGGLLKRIPDDKNEFPQLLLDSLNVALAKHFGTKLLSFVHKPFENKLRTEIDAEPLYTGS